jgi:NADH-quinone oxidoreductase subunit L
MLLSEAVQGGGLFSYAPWIIGFPILGLLINLIIGRRLSEKSVGTIASSAIALSFVVAVIQFIALQAEPEGMRVFVADWITIGDLNLPWALKIDTLSIAMTMMVTGVSTLIHIYAIGYMHEDVRFQGDPGRFTRFFIYFNLFVAAMMILVTADVGLCSYLLIGFWYEKGKDGIGNAIAGKKAFVTNRIGDFGFLIAMFLIFWTFGSLQYDEVFHLAEHGEAISAGAITAITLFLLLGVTGKSAQLPLFVWLPDAMAGPTPVSAIKRVLAYSTISQLGFMVAAVGLGAYVAGMFHLIAHAFFKALLFLSSGSVIQGVEHGLHQLEHEGGGNHHDFDPQDMRNMGGLRSRMNITFWVYMIGGLALAGIPPLAGFFSKDEILAHANQTNPLVYVLLTLAAIFTAFYMGRQILMVFFGSPRSDAAANAKENPPVMTVPLIALAVLSIFGGLLNLPGIHTLTDWMEHTLEHVRATEFNSIVAILSTVFAVVAIALAWRFYGKKFMKKGEPDPLRKPLGGIFVILENKYYVDELYEKIIVNPYISVASFLADVIDWRFWHDWFHDSVLARVFRDGARWLAMGFDLPVIDGAGNGLAKVAQWSAGKLRTLQTGYVRNYALSLFIGFLLFLSYILIR